MTTLQQKKINTQSLGLMSSLFQETEQATQTTDTQAIFVINEQGQEEVITPEMIQSTLTELRAAC